MGARDSIGKAPYGGRFRTIHRAPLWLGDVLPDEARQTWPVVLPVAAAGAASATAAVLTLLRDRPSGSTLAGVAGLLLAALLAEAFPLPLEGVTVSTTSLAIVFIVATATIYGWAEAAAVGMLTVALVEAKLRRPLTRAVFNTGLYVCAGAAAGLVAGRWSDGDLGSLVFAGFLGAAGFYAVNMLLLAAVIARVQATPYPATLRRHVTTTALPFLVIASLTVTVVVLWDRSPFVSLVVVGPLLTIALYERWLHRSLERLREFDRLKDEFIAVISHELRTPLTSVYGAALTLQKHEVRDELRESLLTIVSDESARLARLLDDALSASRLDTKTERFDIQPTDGAEVVRAVAEAARTHLAPGLDLDVVVEDDLPPVAADSDKLRQVLVNLTENAIKYSPDGGRIEIAADRRNGVVRFRVRDEGLGIAPDEQPHIFERFHRVDPNMTRGVGGTGLGLYICRKLVEGMEGRMWVTSREGAGSTFSFELPVALTRG
jgi:signal transduction histidine kinase